MRNILAQIPSSLDKAKIEQEAATFQADKELFSATLQQLLSRPITEKTRTELKEIVKGFPQWIKDSEEIFQLAARFRNEQAAQIFTEKIQPSLHQTANTLDNILNEQMEKVERDAVTLRNLTEGALAINLLLGIGLAVGALVLAH